jgi:HEAT repeat protein
MAAVQALGAPDGPVEDLAAAAQRDAEPGVRRAALEALARAGTPEAVRHLLDLLREGGADRDALLRLLAGVSNPRAASLLLDVLNAAEDRDVRRALITALARLTDPRAFDTLLRAVEWEDAESRMQAMQGLGLLGDSRALPALQARAQRGDPRERSYAETAIRRIESKR